MDPVHRRMITDNLSTLVDLTSEKDLDDMLFHLCQNGVLSEAMVERNKSMGRDIRLRVREFYLKIQMRGPDAFDKLVDTSFQIGHWHIYEIFKPNEKIKKPEQTFHSLKRTPVLPPSPVLTTPVQGIVVNEKIEPIIVTKSKVFNSITHPEIPCYMMKSKNRGVLLMINNIEFLNDIEPKREGAVLDEQKLRSLFEQIGFHQIVIKNNLPKAELLELLENFSKSDALKKTDCLFVIVASHGNSNKGETSVTCEDGHKISITSILEFFNSEKCPLLHNIPKIFIFQLCRGDAPDYGYNSYEKVEEQNKRKSNKSDRTQFDGKSTNIIMRTYSDMLIVHSTVPGFQSHRDRIQGSWYFIAMCNVFMNHCHNTHLDDLFKLVDIDLKEIYLKRNTVQTSSVQSWGFNKHCYLNPGLYE